MALCHAVPNRKPLYAVDALQRVELDEKRICFPFQAHFEFVPQTLHRNHNHPLQSTSDYFPLPNYSPSPPPLSVLFWSICLWTCLFIGPAHIMSSPASSRRRGRPARDSAVSSPARSTRSTRSQQQRQTSSPTPLGDEQLQTTPRASRRIRGDAPVPSSSPMFFQSSPMKGNSSSAETPDIRMDEPSSPVRASSTMDDGETTPRGNGVAALRGISSLIR